MAGWTDLIPLKLYRDYKAQMSWPGIYEIGFLRAQIFTPKYLGMSTVSIYDRIKAHYTGNGSEFVLRYYWEEGAKYYYWRGRRDNLYFHFMRAESGMIAAEREKQLLRKLGVRKDGYYPWNKKFEG